MWDAQANNFIACINHAEIRLNPICDFLKGFFSFSIP